MGTVEIDRTRSCVPGFVAAVSVAPPICGNRQNRNAPLEIGHSHEIATITLVVAPSFAVPSVSSSRSCAIQPRRRLAVVQCHRRRRRDLSLSGTILHCRPNGVRPMEPELHHPRLYDVEDGTTGTFHVSIYKNSGGKHPQSCRLSTVRPSRFRRETIRTLSMIRSISPQASNIGSSPRW